VNGDEPGLAWALVADLRASGQSVATAESLTGGLVVAALVDVPGASACVRGGIVAYQSDVKADLVGVDAGLLASGGAVQAEVAAQLALGAAERLGATWGIGTTGVAGPDAADGQPVGTVYVAVAGPISAGVATRLLTLSGSRAQIRAGAVAGALALLKEQIDLRGGRPGGP
jgi:nicotinamide-nucleotide amidase